jgi:broad specificity polyphosphatase/5'/3'-nucleotidase SurE
VSGLETDCSECIAAATAWVVELAQSNVVRNLDSGQYLTVSIPRKHPSEIKGIRVVKRAPLLAMPIIEKIPPSSENLDVETWVLKPPTEFTLPPAGSDVAVWNSDYIAIVPMSVDEHDYKLLNKLHEKIGKFPNWPASRREKN